VVLPNIPGSIATTPNAPSESAFAEVWKLTKLVYERNACALPGCTIKYDVFLPVMWRAVARGFVKHEHAVFVADGLRQGFTAGVQREQLAGVQRVFRNYKSAMEAMPQVAAAMQKRIDTGKSIVLGDWFHLQERLRSEIDSFLLFPMSAVPKPLEPTEVRPASDHTKTGLNAATLMDFLRHSLTAYRDVAWLFQQGWFMRVSDVEGAFPTLPLAPWLWWFMLFRVTLPSNRHRDTLCMHLFGDFGARGMPGVFNIFYEKVVIPMARSEMVITLPMVVYVDDNGMMGPEAARADAEMGDLQLWCKDVAGVVFKWLKDRRAARRQLLIGFWWDSVARTRTLEEQKVASYCKVLFEFAASRTATLSELRSLAGKVQRALLTFPPGARCLCFHFFALMAGLLLPWQKRRTTAEARFDARFIATMLQMSVGEGYFSYDQFTLKPGVESDAASERRFAGGGYVSQCGRYRFYPYGVSARRRPIAFLEGDTMALACEDLMGSWRMGLVPFGVDNMTVQMSQTAGRAKVMWLNNLMKHFFVLQARGAFILQSYWLSTHLNDLSDPLSRDREDLFLARVHVRPFLLPDARLQRHPLCGKTRTLAAAERPPVIDVLRSELARRETHGLSHASRPRGAGCKEVRGLGAALRVRGGVGRGDQTALYYAGDPVSLLEGLPVHLVERVEAIMDQRWSLSSMRTISSALVKWQVVAARYDWPTVIVSRDPHRGAKMAAFVMYMVDETELVLASISNYVWGLRRWLGLQHQMDPLAGCTAWPDFAKAVEVLTFVAGEPRAEIPLGVVSDMLRALDRDDFQECQFGLFLLILLFTFSRSECPCPKTVHGQDDFDPARHWQVKDILFVLHALRRCLDVNFKGIKQDPRVQRPTARGGVDYSTVGDVPGTMFSVVDWYLALSKHYGGPRDPDAPFFMNRAREHAYTYGMAMADMKMMLRRVGCAESYGLHSLRVLGYNLSKRGNGESLTVAHGLWFSDAHERYERFPMSDVVMIPANMVRDAAASPADAAGQEPGVMQPRVVGAHDRRGRGLADALAAVHGDVPHDGEPAAGVREAPTLPLVPPGFVREERNRDGARPYVVYMAPDGKRCASRTAAWLHHDILRGRAGAGRVEAVSPRSPRSPAHRPAPSPRRPATGSGGAVSTGGQALAAARAAQGPAPGSAAAAGTLADVVPEAQRPSTRRAPRDRSRPRAD
jgi:hypothetical protein